MSKLILFQGDSITDAGRTHDDVHMGFGYPTFVGGALGCDMPGEYRYLNRGISGNRIVDLYARIKSDIINLRPDYMSILIGVNDVWHEIDWQNGVSAEKFEMIYGLMIGEILEALPNIKIMLLEPFALKGSGTSDENRPEKWDTFGKEVLLRAQATRRTAKKYGLRFVPLQEKFDRASASNQTELWLRDGVHPTAAGHELIKREWLCAFEDIK